MFHSDRRTRFSYSPVVPPLKFYKNFKHCLTHLCSFSHVGAACHQQDELCDCIPPKKKCGQQFVNFTKTTIRYLRADIV